jgi:hypothetical protein
MPTEYTCYEVFSFCESTQISIPIFPPQLSQEVRDWTEDPVNLLQLKRAKKRSSVNLFSLNPASFHRRQAAADTDSFSSLQIHTGFSLHGVTAADCFLSCCREADIRLGEASG